MALTNVLHVLVNPRREEIEGKTIKNKKKSIHIFRQLSPQKYNKSKQIIRNNVLGEVSLLMSLLK